MSVWNSDIGLGLFLLVGQWTKLAIQLSPQNWCHTILMVINRYFSIVNCPQTRRKHVSTRRDKNQKKVQTCSFVETNITAENKRVEKDLCYFYFLSDRNQMFTVSDVNKFIWLNFFHILEHRIFDSVSNFLHFWNSISYSTVSFPMTMLYLNIFRN